MTSFAQDVQKSIDHLKGRLDAADHGMASAGGMEGASETPLRSVERSAYEEDLLKLFAIKAAVEPPHASLPDRELRQRHWDIQTRYGLIDPKIPRP